MARIRAIESDRAVVYAVRAENFDHVMRPGDIR